MQYDEAADTDRCMILLYARNVRRLLVTINIKQTEMSTHAAVVRCLLDVGLRENDFLQFFCIFLDD